MTMMQNNNILGKSPYYAEILTEYNRQLSANGKVNNKKFYFDIIAPKIPGYALMTWYSFLRRFKTSHGLEPVNSTTPASIPEAENSLQKTILSNQQATALLIQSILNISAEAAQKALKDPASLSAEDRARIELGLKAMKAQDSRIHAIGKIREDNREEEKLQRTFDSAAY